MSVQVGGQALGPVIAGFMFDYFDSYRIPFTFFAVAVFMAGIMALAAKPPQAPTPAPPKEPAVFRVNPAGNLQFREVDHTPSYRATVPVETPATWASFFRPNHRSRNRGRGLCLPRQGFFPVGDEDAGG